MKNVSLVKRGLSAGVLAIACMAVHAEQVPDTLQQQAVDSRLASKSMLAGLDYAGDRIVAVGIKGHILLSDDHGDTWRQASHVPVTVTLTDVCFNSAAEGWAVGHRGAILKSVDGGEEWTLQYDGFSAAKELLSTLENAGSENAFYGEMMVEDGADKPFLNITCLGDQKAVAVGAYGWGFSTEDGGENWHPSAELFDGTQQMHVYAADKAGDRLYLAGERGLLFAMRPDLTGYEQLASPYDGTYFGIIGAPDGKVLAYGLRGNAFASVDGGATWNASTIDSNQNLTAGLVLRDGGYLLVDNAGRGWKSPDGASFERVAADHAFPLTDLLELQDGDVLATGAGGFARFDSGQFK